MLQTAECGMPRVGKPNTRRNLLPYENFESIAVSGLAELAHKMHQDAIRASWAASRGVRKSPGSAANPPRSRQTPEFSEDRRKFASDRFDKLFRAESAFESAG